MILFSNKVAQHELSGVKSHPDQDMADCLLASKLLQTIRRSSSIDSQMLNVVHVTTISCDEALPIVVFTKHAATARWQNTQNY